MNRISPTITIVDYKGNTLSHNIVSFKYKYAEEGDDVCTFTMKSDDVNLPDHPSLQESQKLTVAWGYFDNSPLTNSRVIYIFDIEYSYDEDGVTINFICHEKFALAKMDSVSNKTIKQLKRDTPIMFSSEAIKAVNLNIEKGNKDLERLLKPINVDKKGLITSTVEKDLTLVSYYNGNLSTFRGLRTYLDRLPGGPYVIDSRDNSVIIRTRDFAQTSLRTFSYGVNNINGLLKFKPESKNRSKAGGSESVSTVSWDKRDKTAIKQTSTKEGTQSTKVKLGTGNAFIKDMQKFGTKKADNLTPGLQKEIDEVLGKKKERGKSYKPQTVTGNSKLAEIIKNQGTVNRRANYGKDLKALDGKYILSEGVIGPDKKPVSKLVTGYDYGKKPDEFLKKGIDNTAVAQTRFEIVEDDKRLSKVDISDEDPDKAKALAENDRENNELENNPATASMEGDPSIESGKIITILGVSKKHSGNYYIKECEHSIDDAGYIVEISKMVRNGTNRDKSSIKKVISPKSDIKTLPKDYEIKDNAVINTTQGDQTEEQRKTKIQSKQANEPWDIDQ